MHKISTYIALTFCFLLPTLAIGQDSKDDQKTGPSYSVDLSDALNHYITVTMTGEATGDTTEVMMAVWTPGSYLVREYAKHVDQIQATTASGRGRPLAMEKTKKNRWTIDTSKAKTFRVTYRLYCNEQSVRTNWVGQSYGVLNGAPTFLTIPEQMDREHTVQLKLPENWRRSATALDEGEEPHQYIAGNYDELVDSPIVAGNINLYPFTVDGVDHTLVNVNEAGIWDGQKAAKDLQKIVAAHVDLWGEIPYERYMFINVICDSGGGLEHDNCCLMMTRRWAFRSEGAYIGWLSLASHEFFHTWNIRRVRPKSLVNYDYENEVYTPSLWVAEGVTSYYEDLLLVRCGLMSKDQFLGMLGQKVSRVQSKPGRKVQSLRDSSHDAWIKFYRPEANSDDTTVSYYAKGSIAAFLLDAEIRSRTNGKNSLDDVLRILYQKYANPVGYLPSDFRKVCDEVAGSDLSDWFARTIDSTDELQWQALANWYGFQIGDIVPLKPGEQPRDPREQRQGRTRWIGIGTPGSPASKAGIADTDEIIAVDGLRLNSSIESRIQEFEIGDAVTLLISRNDKIIELAVTINSRKLEPNWGLSLYRRRTDEQTEHVLQWLTETKKADSKIAEKEKAEKEKLAAKEKAEAELAAKKKAEAERAADKAEAEAMAKKEKAAAAKEKKAAAAKAEKLKKEKAAADREAKEKRMAAKKAAEAKAAEGKALAEQAAKEKAAKAEAEKQKRAKRNKDNENQNEDEDENENENAGGDDDDSDLTEAQQERVDAMVARVLSRYDSNENGKLDKKEINALEGRVDFINRADIDSDGVITATELNKTIADSMRGFRSR